MNATARRAQDTAVFASAAQATAAFISGGTTAHARKARDRSVRRFGDTFGNLAGWAAAPLSRRLNAPVDVRGVAVWLAMATATPVDPGYVAQSHAGWGYRLAELAPDLSVAFTSAASRIGWNDKQAERQWALLAKLAAVAGRPAEALTRPCFDAACDALAGAVKAARGRVPNTVTTPLHGLRATLAAMGILDEPGHKHVPDRAGPGTGSSSSSRLRCWPARCAATSPNWPSACAPPASPSSTPHCGTSPAT